MRTISKQWIGNLIRIKRNDALETEDGYSLLTIHLRLETTLDPLLGSILTAQQPPAKKGPASNSSSNGANAYNDGSGHGWRDGTGGGKRGKWSKCKVHSSVPADAR